MSNITLELTEVELNHLKWCLYNVDDHGEYYGNREHFKKRRKNLWSKIDNAAQLNNKGE